MDVRPLRQRRRVDLHDRADQHDVPVGSASASARDEVRVEALVDDAEEAETRRRRCAACAGCGVADAGREVGGVDAAREAVHGRMQVALRAIQARPAGEDEVGPLQQRVLALRELSRRMEERGQLVHAVVDDRAGLEVAEQRQRHRRVEPRDRARMFREAPARAGCASWRGARRGIRHRPRSNGRAAPSRSARARDVRATARARRRPAPRHRGPARASRSATADVADAGRRSPSADGRTRRPASSVRHSAASRGRQDWRDAGKGATGHRDLLGSRPTATQPPCPGRATARRSGQRARRPDAWVAPWRQSR